MRNSLYLAGVAIAALFACGGSSETDAYNPTYVSGGGAAGSGAAAGSGGTTAQNDAATAPDTGAGGTAPPDGGWIDTTATITCGQQACALANNRVCCVTGASATAYECADRGACPTATPIPVELQCNSDANCAAGSVCCLSHSSGVNSVSRCQTACYPADVHLCNPKAATTGCEAFQTCTAVAIAAWGLPATSYATCE
jgi:hypothetical protein